MPPGTVVMNTSAAGSSMMMTVHDGSRNKNNNNRTGNPYTTRKAFARSGTQRLNLAKDPL
jgi:hypothetical protein